MHSSIRITLFEATFDPPPLQLLHDIQLPGADKDTSDYLESWTLMLNKLKKNLEKSCVAMKKIANTSRSDVSFNVG